MEHKNLNQIAFNNLSELYNLNNDKYITIENLKNIKIKQKSDSLDNIDNIDNIYDENDIEYAIFFTFYQILMYMKNTDDVLIYQDYTRKKILKKMSVALDNLYLMYMDDENEISKLSPILNIIDDLLINELNNYKKCNCYYTFFENITEINNTFKKIIGINYKNHANIIKYYLPDLEPIMYYKFADKNNKETTDSEESDNEESDNEESDNEESNKETTDSEESDNESDNEEYKEESDNEESKEE